MTEITKILSGIQATGNLHIGNYLGSIKNWVELQNNAPSYLFIADLHAITIPYKADNLRSSIYYLTATYLACGLDPEKSAIFAQSQVREHAELAWFLGCLTQIGWLNRMTQFKDKAGKNRDGAGLGLYIYPVLMAADILLYHPSHVPVGEDQKQHIELARDIAGALNRFAGFEYFKMPEPLIIGNATRIMSLRDGTKKMSKSDVSDATRINLTDNADEIRSKIQKAKTDNDVISLDNLDNRSELKNLAIIFGAFSDQNYKEIIKNYEGKNFSDFKKDLAEIIISHIQPISLKINDYINNKDYLLNVLKKGKEKASLTASETLSEIKEIMGFLP